MAIPNLQEFQKVVQEAGLPVGTNLKAMRDARPLAKYAIADSLLSNETQIPQLSQERVAKVQRLADMDQRLHSLYSEGKLKSNNPFLLESALNTATSIEGKNIAATDAAISQRAEDIESQVADVAAFYSDLISSEARAQVGSGEEIDFEAEINAATGIGLDEYSDDELDAILKEAGLDF